MPYPALLTVHLLAIAIFLGGLAFAAALLPGLAADPARRPELARIRAINLWATTPALLVVWACGIAMAIEGGWFVAGWLHAKILLVLLLSAVHGRQTATLRRVATGVAVKPVGYGMMAAAILLAIGAIALAVVKPF